MRDKSWNGGAHQKLARLSKSGGGMLMKGLYCHQDKNARKKNSCMSKCIPELKVVGMTENCELKQFLHETSRVMSKARFQGNKEVKNSHWVTCVHSGRHELANKDDFARATMCSDAVPKFTSKVYGVIAEIFLQGKV